ncbi:MAG: aminotransferase class V-fold PLP-dependent enzyme [Deltaproteobacteria bacterium]|nr:aminotransferase class V-fold PLP-dependent enzyme [Deltaproteobacteria bacterium]
MHDESTLSDSPGTGGEADANRWSGCRSEFPVAGNITYLNHAAVSPVPLRTAEAVAGLFREFTHEGISRFPDWLERVEAARGSAAQLLGAEAREVAFAASTSDGVSAVAESLDWKPGEAVLVPRPDFPTNIYPWMHLERRGVQVQFYERRQGRFHVEDVERALVPGTRLLTVSSVDFASGFHCDLEALGDFCRRKGLLFFVDAIQGLGAVPMNVRRFQIHFLAAGGHKWLLSAMGCGLLFTAHEVLDRLVPNRVGWRSVLDETAFDRLHLDFKPDAARFEAGSSNLPGICALGASIGLLLEAGVDRIQQRILELNNQFHAGLEERGLRVTTPMGDGERSGILCFETPSDAQALWRFLDGNRVSVSLRRGAIRLAPHFYNNENDVARFFRVLDRAPR